MELTKKQKKKVMEKVLELILEDQKNKRYHGYICNSIREAVNELGYIHGWIAQSRRLRLFPELLKYKPNDIENDSDAWWNDKTDESFDYDSRITVVKKLIEEYSN